jgi:hypothetical protein
VALATAERSPSGNFPRTESGLADSVLAESRVPLDPGRDWLAAGITGLQRQREWDAVATVDGDGTPGAEVAFVALADGTFVVESGDGVEPASLAAALRDGVSPPYRVLAVRRPEFWAVGAVAIEVERLDPDPPGTELELTWDGSTAALSVDRLPADPARAAALARIAAARQSGAYAAHAHRLRGDVWELSVLAL